MSPTTAATGGAALTGEQLETLLARIRGMSVSELAALPREEVRAWPGDPLAEGDITGNPRAVRRQRMLGSRQRVKIEDIAYLAGVGRDAVAKWRSANIKTPGRATTRALVDPIPLTPDELARLDDRRRRSGKEPKPSRDWYDGEVWLWLYDTERVDVDLYPPDAGRGGRRSSGRPPQQRRGD